MKGCRPLTDQETREVACSFQGRYAARDKALFILGLKTGFRISELLSLRIGDVFQAGKMVDRVTVPRRNMKKKLEGRTVLLHPDAKAALGEWIMEMQEVRQVPKDTYLFRSQKSAHRPIGRRHARRVLRRVFDAQALTGSLGTHSMRKTFAHRVYEKLDRDLLKTQRAMGHKNINSTVSYLSFREEEIDAAILEI